MEHNEHSTPDDDVQTGAGPSGSASPRTTVGQLLRDAREKAGIPVAKLCADLRIAPSTLTALEEGEYDKLAGPPYVRAMLVSLSRYLRLDTREVLKVYSEEAGDVDSTVTPVSPYKDDSGTHAKAHKQIFILLLAVLLFVLLLIMGKVNTGAPEPEPVEPPVAADTLLNIVPPDDTTFTDPPSDSLDIVDSVAVSDFAVEEEPDTLAAEDPETPETSVRITAWADGIWLRILPAGERETSLYLYAGKPVDFNHPETITFITRKGGTVRVTTGDQEKVPSGRRFKVDGTQIN